MLLCAIFRVEMDMEIDAEEVCHVRNAAAHSRAAQGETP
jgi:hypothetical protein